MMLELEMNGLRGCIAGPDTKTAGVVKMCRMRQGVADRLLRSEGESRKNQSHRALNVEEAVPLGPLLKDFGIRITRPL